MRIGIEAERANAREKTGVEHYSKQLILSLAAADRENGYTLYLRTEPEAWFLSLPKNFSVKVMPFPLFWTQIRLSLEMLLHPPDVLLVPASALPLVHPPRSVAVVHDVAWRFFPEAETAFNLRFLEWSTRFALRAAWRVIAVSQSTAKDLVRCYGVDSAKLRVVHHGFEAPPKTSAGLPPGTPDRYVLFLSTLQPRKNVVRLIDAFVALKKKRPDLPQKLVIAGRRGWNFAPIVQAIEQNREHVVYLGHVADRLTLMARAECFVLPSLYEGFGMTLLEAFAAGVPVATSKVSSMPEVAGEAAVYFDPSNEREIGAAVERLLDDASLRARLVLAGTARLKAFSWERCARETLGVLAERP